MITFRFEIGDTTDVTLLASYQKRDYIRQPGLPIQNDYYKKYPETLFIGEPNHKVKDETYRFGYQLNHDFNNDWQWHQNFALSKRDADMDAVLASGQNPLDKAGNIKRQQSLLTKKDTIISMDNRFDKTAKIGQTNHKVSLGLDMYRERSDYAQLVYAYSPFNPNLPVYGVGKITNANPLTNNHTLGYLQYLGLYAKDTIELGDKWRVGLSGRHDWSEIESDNLRGTSVVKNSDKSFTGNASLMYKINDRIAPYFSYATSFLATMDAGKDGDILKPEKGKQAEIGVKLQSINQRIQGALSYYDLTRKNVSESYTDEDQTYNIAVGKQKTKGFEAEAKAEINENWNIATSYSYIPTAKIIQAANNSDYVVGQRLNHIPKNAFALSTQYYFEPSHLGWYLGAGVRYEGEHHLQRRAILLDLPSYTLYDAEAGYEAKNWRVNFSVNNLTDKTYYLGSALIMFGDPRTFRINLTYKF